MLKRREPRLTPEERRFLDGVASLLVVTGSKGKISVSHKLHEHSDHVLMRQKSHHVETKAKEHINFGSSVKIKIKEGIIECHSCIMNRFAVVAKCLSDHDCKIHEALLIIKKAFLVQLF